MFSIGSAVAHSAAAVLALPTVALDLVWGCTRLLEGVPEIGISLLSSRDIWSKVVMKRGQIQGKRFP
jgi:hypothetical protein